MFLSAVALGQSKTFNLSKEGIVVGSYKSMQFKAATWSFHFVLILAVRLVS